MRELGRFGFCLEMNRRRLVVSARACGCIRAHDLGLFGHSEGIGVALEVSGTVYETDSGDRLGGDVPMRSFHPA